MIRRKTESFHKCICTYGKIYIQAERREYSLDTSYLHIGDTFEFYPY